MNEFEVEDATPKDDGDDQPAGWTPSGAAQEI